MKSASLRLCGHVIHEKCYLDYRRSVQGSHNTAPSFDPACEFLCPLCKSVSNVIMPMLPGARNSAAASSDRSRATEETKTEREHAHEAKEAGTGSPDAVLLPRFDETVFVPFVESLELGEATLAQTLVVVGDRVKLHRGFGPTSSGEASSSFSASSSSSPVDVSALIWQVDEVNGCRGMDNGGPGVVSFRESRPPLTSAMLVALDPDAASADGAAHEAVVRPGGRMNLIDRRMHDCEEVEASTYFQEDTLSPPVSMLSRAPAETAAEIRRRAGVAEGSVQPVDSEDKLRCEAWCAAGGDQAKENTLLFLQQKDRRRTSSPSTGAVRTHRPTRMLQRGIGMAGTPTYLESESPVHPRVFLRTFPAWLSRVKRRRLKRCLQTRCASALPASLFHRPVWREAARRNASQFGHLRDDGDASSKRLDVHNDAGDATGAAFVYTNHHPLVARPLLQAFYVDSPIGRRLCQHSAMPDEVRPMMAEIAAIPPFASMLSTTVAAVSRSMAFGSGAMVLSPMSSVEGEQIMVSTTPVPATAVAKYRFTTVAQLAAVLAPYRPRRRGAAEVAAGAAPGAAAGTAAASSLLSPHGIARTIFGPRVALALVAPHTLPLLQSMIDTTMSWAGSLCQQWEGWPRNFDEPTRPLGRACDWQQGLDTVLFLSALTSGSTDEFVKVAQTVSVAHVLTMLHARAALFDESAQKQASASPVSTEEEVVGKKRPPQQQTADAGGDELVAAANALVGSAGPGSAVLPPPAFRTRAQVEAVLARCVPFLHAVHTAVAVVSHADVSCGSGAPPSRGRGPVAPLVHFEGGYREVARALGLPAVADLAAGRAPTLVHVATCWAEHAVEGFGTDQDVAEHRYQSMRLRGIRWEDTGPDPVALWDRMRVSRWRRTLASAAAPFTLVPLPHLFTDLYTSLRTKTCWRCCKPVTSTIALCLLCGDVMCAGDKRCRHPDKESPSDPLGSKMRRSCTRHAIQEHGGMAVYYLVQENVVLISRGDMAAFWDAGSLYVDANGEDVGRIAGKKRPLFLSPSRRAALQYMVATHNVGAATSGLRSVLERVVKLGWY